MIHRDEEGVDLLTDCLARISADVITLEFSNYGLEFRRQKGDEYRKKIKDALELMACDKDPYDAKSLSSLTSFIDLPYEYVVASRYAGEHEASLYLIDMDAFSYLRLRKAGELFDEDNIRQILSGPPPTTDTEKAAAKLFFEKGLKLSSYDDEMYMRDKYMSKRIALLMKQHAGKKFLHICGWQHLEDPYGLYHPLNPLKVFLYDETFCL